MNKNYLIVFVVIAVLFSHNQASAGLFDWIAGSTTLDGDDLPFEQIYSAITDASDGKNASSLIGFSSVQSNAVTPAIRVPVTSAKKAAGKTYTVSVSAYSSTPDQTDDSPFITASNTYVRDGIVAANFLPFGTRIKIPKLFGNKVFVVEDRMNKRYLYNVDIWFPDRETAKQFGRKTVNIEVVSL